MPLPQQHEPMNLDLAMLVLVQIPHPLILSTLMPLPYQHEPLHLDSYCDLSLYVSNIVSFVQANTLKSPNSTTSIWLNNPTTFILGPYNKNSGFAFPIKQRNCPPNHRGYCLMSLFDFLTYYKILKRYYHLNRILTMPAASQTLFLPQVTFASDSSAITGVFQHQDLSLVVQLIVWVQGYSGAFFICFQNMY